MPRRLALKQGVIPRRSRCFRATAGGLGVSGPSYSSFDRGLLERSLSRGARGLPTANHSRVNPRAPEKSTATMELRT